MVSNSNAAEMSVFLEMTEVNCKTHFYTDVTARTFSEEVTGIHTSKTHTYNFTLRWQDEALNPVGKFKYETIQPLKALNSST